MVARPLAETGRGDVRCGRPPAQPGNPASGRPERGTVPQLRPFRALRYATDVVPDLAAVVAPPYDVVSPEQHRALLGRDPRNVVRLDLPETEPGDQPDDRYRRAARTLAAWRSDGTLRKDPRPSFYVYEQEYRVPGTEVTRIQRGFFGRLRLEEFGPESGVRPHERTLAAAREDRYKLLRATGVNTSPVVVLFDDAAGRAEHVISGVVATAPGNELRDDDGVGQRLWPIPDDGSDDGPVATLAAAAGQEAVTIADGHHRYETALRYRDERRMSRSCEEDPPFDYLLALFLASNQPLTVLPTHRLALGLGPDGVATLRSRLGELFEVRDGVTADELRRLFGDVADAGGAAGRGVIGLWTRSEGAILTARPGAFDPLFAAGGPAYRALDVARLGIALESLAGIDADAVAAGDRIGYTKSADEAIERVEAGVGVDAAFLLRPTPVAAIEAVAAEGDVMPQKSTYFYPKALTGLVINPHEW